ncbi:MAG: helix-turn-helix domain-containing protein [Sphingomonas sp.]|nr:helix-turn-helix domain-containing protein [Sphingomonas sp.]MDX3882824.1 helix-turn-helix domain-containing protein [Sphingomonas sp.]
MKKGVSVSTDHIEPSLRSEFWREMARPLFELLPLEPGEDHYRGAVQSVPFGRMTLASISFNRQHYNRNRRTILRSGLDDYLLQLVVAGTLRADCDGIPIAADVGDICVFDLARPFTSRAEPGSRITMLVPRDPIDRAAGGRSLHGHRLAADTPVTRLLAGCLTHFHAVAGDLDQADAAAMEDSVAGLLAAALTRKPIVHGDAAPIVSEGIRRRIARHIDDHIADTTLSPRSIMREFQISRAHLYRLFAEEGGIATLIRDKRLDAAFRFLALERNATLPIADLGYRLGFPNPSRFSKAFRARFAMTPREARNGGAENLNQILGGNDIHHHLADVIARIPPSRRG